MAECEPVRGAELDPCQFICSVCLDLLKDPVSIPCGHSFCKGCIEGFWDQNEEKGDFSCPQCRQVFTPRPVLGRNNMLAEVVELLKRTNIKQASPSTPGSAPAAEAPAAEACSDPADIPCDFCCGSTPNKATMSCLTCVVSYCPEHLKPHYSIPALKKHQLVSASVPLQEKMCLKHNKLMEVYCKTDRKCICYLCVLDEHQAHSTVSAAAERTEQQTQLSVSRKKVQERQKEGEQELILVLEALEDFKKCSKTAVMTTDCIIAEMVSSIKKKGSLIVDMILAQEKKAGSQAEGLRVQLEEEITKLRLRDAELEQISHIDDHIYFIQTFQSLLACESQDLLNGPFVRSKCPFNKVTDCVSSMKSDLEELLKKAWPAISATVSSVKVLLQPEPKTRQEFLHYCCLLQLDKSAVSQNMTLSNENLTVSCKTVQKYHPYDNMGFSSSMKLSYPQGYYVNERTTSTEQMWCSKGLTAQCYWEISFSGSTWCVAVSYKNSNGQLSLNSQFGLNNRSWSLECSKKGCSFKHNSQSMPVSNSAFKTIGVYLDFPEGILSFYGVNGSTMTLIHKAETTFTEPLYPCIGFREDGSEKSSAYSANLIKLWQ